MNSIEPWDQMSMLTIKFCCEALACNFLYLVVVIGRWGICNHLGCGKSGGGVWRRQRNNSSYSAVVIGVIDVLSFFLGLGVTLTLRVGVISSSDVDIVE